MHFSSASSRRSYFKASVQESCDLVCRNVLAFPPHTHTLVGYVMHCLLVFLAVLIGVNVCVFV